METLELIKVFLTNQIVSITLSIIIILILTKIALKFNQKAFKLGTEKLIKSGQTNVSYMSFLRHAGVALIYFIAIITIVKKIPPLEDLTTTLLASSGVLAVILGFASQEAMGNIVSGVMILTFKPFIIGDNIRHIGMNIIGTVEDITLRHTVIKTLENKRVIIPNGSMGKDVIENSNFIESKVCSTFEIGISYESSIDSARSIIVDNASSHKDYFDNRSDEDVKNGAPKIVVRVTELGDSAVVLKTWIWAKDAGTAFSMKCDLLESIKNDFDKKNINIPYPHITLTNK